MNCFKNLFRQLLLLTSLSLIIILSFFVQGCDDDDEPKDVTLPEIAFTNLTADMKVWNTVVIALEASDDLGLSEIQIFVDDELVTTLTQAPFETSWDSNQVPDGVHTVSVVASDKSGNSKESTVNIIVRNTLLSIDVPADQLITLEDVSERGFVFLSDEDGKVIASVEYTNGNEVTLKSQTFNGEKFFLTEVLGDFEGGAFTWVSAWTWPAIERGSDWVLIKGLSDDKDYAGVADVAFQNLAAESQYMGATNGDQFFVSEETIMSLNLLKSPSKLYVMRDSWADESGPLAYGLFSDLVPGNNTIDLSQVNQPLSVMTATLPEATTIYSLSLYGLVADKDFSEWYPVDYATTGATPNTVDVYYPGTAFPGYYGDLYLETPYMYYWRTIGSEELDLSSPEASITMDFVDSKLLYSSSGPFDFASMRLMDENGRKRWIFLLPHGEDQAVPTLAMPAGMEALALPPLGLPPSYSIHDFDATDSYEDLTAYVPSSTRSVDGLYDFGEIFLNIEYIVPESGGRLKIDAGRKRNDRVRHGLR